MSAPLCPVHKVPMKESEREPGGFYCTQKIGAGPKDYCKQKVKPPKPNAAPEAVGAGQIFDRSTCVAAAARLMSSGMGYDEAVATTKRLLAEDWA